MTDPKRHHWWPQLQSRHWASEDGCLCVAKSDGTYFRTNPLNAGVEGELYTRFGENGKKDVAIEKWFSTEIEAPFAEIFEEFISFKDVKRQPFRPDPIQAERARALGIVILPYREYVHVSNEHREIVARYISALIVRNPHYLKKIAEYQDSRGAAGSKADLKNLALDNMLQLFRTYNEVVSNSMFMFVQRHGDTEFVFSDAGVTVNEPWNGGPIPFDAHVPLTPDLSLQVLPIPDNHLRDIAFIARANNRGVKRWNRIAVGDAKRFVFTRSAPPMSFIQKHMGVPAPTPFGFTYVDGKLSTVYDPKRDER